MTLACLSAVLRAAERNLSLTTGVPCCDSTLSTCHEEAIIAAVLIAVVATASSAAINWLTGTSPLTARLHNDIMTNICGMKAEEVEPIVHKLFDALTQVQKDHEGQTMPFPNQLFYAIYDLQTLDPKPDYKAALENAVALMREAGVPISDSLSLS